MQVLLDFESWSLWKDLITLITQKNNLHLSVTDFIKVRPFYQKEISNLDKEAPKWPFFINESDYDNSSVASHVIQSKTLSPTMICRALSDVSLPPLLESPLLRLFSVVISLQSQQPSSFLEQVKHPSVSKHMHLLPGALLPQI